MGNYSEMHWTVTPFILSSSIKRACSLSCEFFQIRDVSNILACYGVQIIITKRLLFTLIHHSHNGGDIKFRVISSPGHLPDV